MMYGLTDMVACEITDNRKGKNTQLSKMREMEVMVSKTIQIFIVLSRRVHKIIPALHT
jgi:hypothetical protein